MGGHAGGDDAGASAAYTCFTLRVARADREEAVGALLGLPTRGWQEEEGLGDDGLGVFKFWLSPQVTLGERVQEQLEHLSALGPLTAAPEVSDWEQGWRKFHQPVQVGRVLVRAPWHAASPRGLDVVIEAGMAFGTGGHTTTRQCLRALQSIAPGSLLDVGCGSGVLAIAAARLGYAPLYAVDNDELAVAAAAENAARNGVRLRPRQVDVLSGSEPLPTVDVIVANVALGPLVALGRRVTALPDLPRDVVLAGLLADQLDDALGAWPRSALVEQSVDGEWVAVHLRFESRERSR